MSAFGEHLRLTLLRLLAGAPAYRANSSILHAQVVKFGFAASRDQIRSELTWLAEQGAVVNEDLMELLVTTLTSRGLDAAEGRCHIPGVQKPSPRG